MRMFIYKTLFIFLCIIITFKLTVGSLVSTLENKIFELSSKKNITYLQNKIRKEINSSLSKENILEKEDAVIIRKFFDKISKEIKETD
jgi:hypothetical protein